MPILLSVPLVAVRLARWRCVAVGLHDPVRFAPLTSVHHILPESTERTWR